MSGMYNSDTVVAAVALTVSALTLVLVLVYHFEQRLAPLASAPDSGLTSDTVMLLGEIRTLARLARPGQPAPVIRGALPGPSPVDDATAELEGACEQLRELRHEVSALVRSRPASPLPADAADAAVASSAAAVAVAVDAPTSVERGTTSPEPQPPATGGTPATGAMPATGGTPTTGALTATPADRAPATSVLTAARPRPTPAPSASAEPPPAATSRPGPTPTGTQTSAVSVAQVAERHSVRRRVMDSVQVDNLGPSLVYLREKGGVVSSEEAVPGSSAAVAKLLTLRLARADDRGVYLTETGHEVASQLLSRSR